MAPFTVTQWVVVALIFVLGVLIGMFVFAGAKWKRRWREELALRQQLEVENKRLRDHALETDSLHRAALKNPVSRPRDAI